MLTLLMDGGKQSRGKMLPYVGMRQHLNDNQSLAVNEPLEGGLIAFQSPPESSKTTTAAVDCKQIGTAAGRVILAAATANVGVAEQIDEAVVNVFSTNNFLKAIKSAVKYLFHNQ